MKKYTFALVILKKIFKFMSLNNNINLFTSYTSINIPVILLGTSMSNIFYFEHITLEQSFQTVFCRALFFEEF